MTVSILKLIVPSDVIKYLCTGARCEANQSVRVQMSQETRQLLENLAEQYGCLYGGKPHISGLLAQVADGRLVVSRAVTHQQTRFPKGLLFKLRIWFSEGLRGTFAQIADKIAGFGGNILKAEVLSEPEKGFVQIVLCMPENCDLSSFITTLQNMRVKDVVNFNNSEEILTTLNQTKRLNYNLYKEHEIDVLENSSIQERLLADVLKQPLLHDISCTIGLRLIAKNQVGTLAKITYEIAEQGFFISSVRQEFEASENLDIIEILLTLHTTPQWEISNEIEKIQTIVKTIEKIPTVKNVQRLGVDYL